MIGTLRPGSGVTEVAAPVVRRLSDRLSDQLLERYGGDLERHGPIDLGEATA